VGDASTCASSGKNDQSERAAPQAGEEGVGEDILMERDRERERLV
jgi:hypothetical protein